MAVAQNFARKCTENQNWCLKDKAVLVVQGSVLFVVVGGSCARMPPIKFGGGRGPAPEKLESDGNTSKT